MIQFNEVLYEHYRRYLGQEAKSSGIKLGSEPPLSIFLEEYKNVPSQNAVTLITLGLSSAPSHSIKEELLFICYEQYITDELNGLLANIARDIVNTQHPLYRGEVLKLKKPLLGTEMSALYVYPPVYLSDEFCALEINDTLSIKLAWLIPIHASEAALINKSGSKAFATLLQTLDPDLMDFQRAAII